MTIFWSWTIDEWKIHVGPSSVDYVQANPPWNCGTVTQPGLLPPNRTKGYECPFDQGQYCTPAIGNPNYGFTGFDNIAQAALLMIQVCTKINFLLIVDFCNSVIPSSISEQADLLPNFWYALLSDLHSKLWPEVEYARIRCKICNGSSKITQSRISLKTGSSQMAYMQVLNCKTEILTNLLQILGLLRVGKISLEVLLLQDSGGKTFV